MRTDSSICWPIVVAEHGDRDGYGIGIVVTGGVRWRAVCLAFQLLDCHDFAPRLDVRLWLTGRDHLTLEPVTLLAGGGMVPDELAVALDDVLVSGGRSRLALHWRADEDTWSLTD
ncbi:hypothetical protein [Nocardia fluminea]|uniref:hypothetical protein n=1 Tax=Nocardia fluminea TaxID=134984 RepID=UPI003D10594D